MKKLSVLLSLMLASGSILGTLPQQSIFTDEYAYDCVPVNIDKLVVANSILSSERKGDFYRDLVKIYLTKENLLNLINSQYNNSGKTITSVTDLHIGEILKEQKNILIRENHKIVMDCGFFMGDNIGQDYQAVLMQGVIFTGIGTYLQCMPVANIGALVSIGSLYKLYKLNSYVRTREAQINEIDSMISKIEEFEQAEASA